MRRRVCGLLALCAILIDRRPRTNDPHTVCVCGLLALCATLMAGCGGSEVPTVGAPTSFAAICDKANDGKRLALEGYLVLPEQFRESGSVMLRLRPATEPGGQVVGVEMHVGDSPNQLKPLADKYQDSDLSVRAVNGAQMGYTDRVRVSGTVYFPMSSSVEFACALTNPLVEPAK